jgi:outer membrane protein
MKITNLTGKYLIASTMLVSVLFLASCGGKNTEVEESETEKTGEETIEKSSVEVPAGALKIGFIRSDSVNGSYLYLIDRKKELENESLKAEGTLKAEYNRLMKKQQELEGKFKFMTVSEQQGAQEEMMKLSEKYRMMEEKVGMELQEKNAFFQKQLYENVEAYLAKYAEANGFDFIFRYEMGLNLMYGSKKYDITTDVMKGLNEEYKSTMGK